MTIRGLTDEDKRKLDQMWQAHLQSQAANQRRTRSRQVASATQFPQMIRLAKADSDITAGSSATASIYSDPSTDSGDNVTVYLDWMDGGADISAGKELLIMWFAGEQKWRVIGAECE